MVDGATVVVVVVVLVLVVVEVLGVIDVVLAIATDVVDGSGTVVETSIDVEGSEDDWYTVLGIVG